MTPRALRVDRFKKDPSNFGCTARPPQSVNRAPRSVSRTVPRSFVGRFLPRLAAWIRSACARGMKAGLK
jgi:hypothetical protein